MLLLFFPKTTEVFTFTNPNKNVSQENWRPPQDWLNSLLPSHPDFIWTHLHNLTWLSYAPTCYRCFSPALWNTRVSWFSFYLMVLSSLPCSGLSISARFLQIESLDPHCSLHTLPSLVMSSNFTAWNAIRILMPPTCIYPDKTFV